MATDINRLKVVLAEKKEDKQMAMRTTERESINRFKVVYQ